MRCANHVLRLLILLDGLINERASSQLDWNRTLGFAAVEDLSEEFGDDLDHALVDHEDVVVGEKGALLLERLALLLQLLDTENAADSLTKCGRERVRSDEVLVCSLRVLGKDADLGIARNDWVRQGTVQPSVCIIA